MRIAYVINSAEGGGAASPIPALAAILRNQGAEVRVFALAHRDGHALPAWRAAGLDPLVRTGGRHDHIAALHWLAREIRAWGATHLWTSLTRATVLGLLLARRDLPAFCWQHAAFLKAGNRLLLRLLQRRAALWLADSAAVATLTRARLGVAPERLLTWPIFAADTTAPTATPWEPGRPLRLGSMGRLHPVKGYEVLIAALVRLRLQGFRSPAPFTITIAGEGLERARLEAAARDGGVTELRLPGFVHQPGQFLASLDLYVQPSRSEGFCIAAHEAMVAGVPVLASTTGELQHSIVDGVTGGLVGPGDPAALADGLARLLSRPEQLYPMGLAARARIVELYSPERFAEMGSELFRRMTAASAGHLTASPIHCEPPA